MCVGGWGLFSSHTEKLKQHYMQIGKYTCGQETSACSLTKPTKQSQILPGVSQPTSFSISSCPLLEPRLAWRSMGGVVLQLGQGGG